MDVLIVGEAEDVVSCPGARMREGCGLGLRLMKWWLDDEEGGFGDGGADARGLPAVASDDASVGSERLGGGLGGGQSSGWRVLLLSSSLVGGERSTVSGPSRRFRGRGEMTA